MARATPFVAMVTAAATTALVSQRGLSADVQESSTQPRRKPIYDNEANDQSLPSAEEVHASTVSPTTPTPVSALPTRTRPSPTDRLAVQVKRTRLFLHHYLSTLERGINKTMTRALRLEADFTSTLGSLAPSRESGERLLPGAIYVLVASMAGSIVTRNRGVFLRATVPLGTGLVAAYGVLPVTTKNVERLAAQYEERFPVIRDNHVRAREGIRHFVETGKAHSQMGLARVDEKLQESRERLERWVQKGR